jgi:predicted enzyme related to lactoylglutathione lyase
MPRVVHFEIHATNPEVLVTFYTGLFGWKLSRWSEMPYWMVETGAEGDPGINGGLLQRMGPAPAEGQAVNAFVCTVEVPSLDDFFGRALELGGSVAVPKMAIPGVGWLAYVKDPDGNILGLMQTDPSAK